MITKSLLKIKNIVERIIVCYYVLTAHSFWFFSCGPENNYKKGMAAYEQNTSNIFEDVIVDFLTNKKYDKRGI